MWLTRCVPALWTEDDAGTVQGLSFDNSPRWLRVWGIQGPPVSPLVSFFFRALYAIGNYISGWFVSEGGVQFLCPLLCIQCFVWYLEHSRLLALGD